MAIDAQFVPYAKLMLYTPTTLMHLEDRLKDMKDMPGVKEKLVELWWCLEHDCYAQAITDIVWPDHHYEEVMHKTLKYPEALWGIFYDRCMEEFKEEYLDEDESDEY